MRLDFTHYLGNANIAVGRYKIEGALLEIVIWIMAISKSSEFPLGNSRGNYIWEDMLSLVFLLGVNHSGTQYIHHGMN